MLIIQDKRIIMEQFNLSDEFSVILIISEPIKKNGEDEKKVDTKTKVEYI